MGSLDLVKFMGSARQAVLAASDVLWHYFGSDADQLEATSKRDRSIQTRADIESEHTILAMLKPYSDQCAVYSEEEGMAGSTQAEFCLLIDPLDGTSNYYRGRDGFGISIAVIQHRSEHKEVILAITYEPSTKRLWSAIKGHGCQLEVVGSAPPEAVSVSSTAPSEGDVCYDASTIRHGLVRGARHKADVISHVIPMYKNIRLMGSNVLAHALVANGSFEAAITDTVGGPFDTAGYLLVEEAGGSASSLDGRPVNVLSDKVVVTSNGVGHEELIRRLRELY